jgi:signal peptidase II
MIFIAVLIVFLLDQFAKIYLAKNFLLNQSVPLVKGILYFTLVHNRGAAFGILKNQLPVFIFTAAVAIVLIYLNLKKNKKKGLSVYNFALSLILAGALGNLVDRLTLGYVIDFIDFRIWPVFNVADSAITMGAILLGYHILFGGQKNKTCIR